MDLRNLSARDAALSRLRGLTAAAFWITALFSSSAARAIVITEIHYGPPGTSNESRRAEFIELFNEDPDPLDLTGYFFSDGVDYQFPSRTFLKGFSYVVVAADSAFTRQKYGIENVVGDWDGSSALNNGGERISLSNPAGAVEATVDYGVRGKWPAGAAGTGHTLSIRDPYSDPESSESWTLSAQLGGTPGVENFPSGVNDSPIVFNEGLLLTAGARWVELFNRSNAPVDLEGYHLTDDPAALTKATIPAPAIVPAKGWLVLEDVPLELNFSLVDPDPRDEVFVALVDPAGQRVVDAFLFRPQIFEASEVRLPDGSRNIEPAGAPTRGAANQVDVTTDVVINEIQYHPFDEDPAREFVELFNRGSVEVNLTGWRFTDGIQFELPEGTKLGAGKYLVVARDPQRIRDIYGLPATDVVGPQDDVARGEFGVLSDGGERLTLVDFRGNTADTVKYEDGGDWPSWSDGGGSTLELIDPWQDNDCPQSWDASDDSAKAPVSTFEYTTRPLAGQVGESEIHVMLLSSGITLVDDLNVPGEATTNTVEDQVYAGPGDPWRYFKGTAEPSTAAGDWLQPEFDDSTWFEGALPIGYNETGLVTELTDMRFGYFSVYLRRKFEVTDAAAVEKLLLEVDYDDGYVAYLNGNEIARGNLTGNPPAHDAPATESRESGTPAQLDVSAKKGFLRTGSNVLAIQVHNNIVNSPDCFLNARFFAGRVVDVPAGWNMVPDGDFEEPLDSDWWIQGTHVQSGRTTTRPIAGAASLKVVATGSGDEKVNHIEHDLLRAIVANRDYKISFKARWVVGSRSILTMGDHFGLGHSQALDIPENVGTPGAPNGVTQRQADREGEANLGPVIDQVTQNPPAPGPSAPVTIAARVQDSDGVASVVLRYSLNTAAGPFQTIAMTGPDAEGKYRAEIPGQPALTRIVYEILAQDSRGHGGRYPLDIPKRTHPLLLDPDHPAARDLRWSVYGHSNDPTTAFHSYRFWMHKENEDYLSSRSVHSDDYVAGSFVFGTSQIYPGSEMRFQGSALSRAGWGGSFRVRMPDDAPLHGRFSRFNLDQDGLSIRDRISHYLVRNNTGAITVPYCNHAFATWRVNSRPIGTRVRIDPPGASFLSKWFPDDSLGELFEVDERYNFSDSGVAQSRRNAYWLYPPYPSEGSGDDKEAYRFYFSLRTDEDDDDFSHLIETAKLFTASKTPLAEFDEKIFEALNVEEFLRILTIRQNTGDWDTWAGIFGRSAYFFRPRGDARWWLFHWDSDKAYMVDGRPVDTHPLPPTPQQTFENPFPEVERLLNRPLIKRMYYAILKEMIDGHFGPEYLDPYLDLLVELGATPDSVAIGRPNGFIDQRAKLIRGWLGPHVTPQRRLEFTTNAGGPFSTDAASIALEGTAPADVTTLVLSVGGAPAGGSPPAFSPTAFFDWSAAAVPLHAGANEITIFGFGPSGELIDSDTIVVTRGSGSPAFGRGDADGDGSLNLTDAVRILGYLYQGGTLPCPDAADADDNGRLEITDPIRILSFLFLGGDALPPPFGATGPDPTPDDLDCEASPAA